jgi:hypothetical protein
VRDMTNAFTPTSVGRRSPIDHSGALVVKVLMPHVEGRRVTLQTRQCRIIAGLAAAGTLHAGTLPTEACPRGGSGGGKIKQLRHPGDLEESADANVELPAEVDRDG